MKHFTWKIVILTIVLVAAIIAAAIWLVSNKKGNLLLQNPIQIFQSQEKEQKQTLAPVELPMARVIYACDGGKMIGAAFFKGQPKAVNPGEPPIPSGKVNLILNDGKAMGLAQTVSADGGRYANGNESFVFWDKGDGIIVLQNGAEKNYTNCRIQISQWQTYTNGQFGYRIDYPADWIFREFPGTLSGAGFRAASSTNEIASECITVDERGATDSDFSKPFADYVKKAAVAEIQGYEKLDSIEPVISESGLAGFKTTWKYKDSQGQAKISLPITYFENKKTVGSGKDQAGYKTVQISLNDEACRMVYNEMIATLSLIQ